MTKICFATQNRNKIQEVQAMLAPDFELVSLADLGCTEELAEDQDSLEGNSLQKAMFIWNSYQVSCFADDSGLEVEALGGAPGVHSAHYAGPQRSYQDNVQLLLANMQGHSNRKARFRTCITLVLNGVVHQFEGTINGHILQTPRGSKGFGYDPVFMPEGYGQTFAEMELDEKNRISHRSKAVYALVEFLKKLS